MEPLNDENKLQVEKKTKIENYEKYFKSNNIIHFNSFCYKLTALSNSKFRKNWAGKMSNQGKEKFLEKHSLISYTF